MISLSPFCGCRAPVSVTEIGSEVTFPVSAGVVPRIAMATAHLLRINGIAVLVTIVRPRGNRGIHVYADVVVISLAGTEGDGAKVIVGEHNVASHVVKAHMGQAGRKI